MISRRLSSPFEDERDLEQPMEIGFLDPEPHSAGGIPLRILNVGYRPASRSGVTA
jgi:hypothetical protein